MLQYGFVVLFATAFPLAPLFALLNNVFEIRGDAKKFIQFYQRPVGDRINNIGVWLGIIQVVSMLSLLTNACIIAFSSSFVPSLVYKLTVSPNFTVQGYFDYSLSIFRVSDLDRMPRRTNYTGSECRYIAFREPPNSPEKYSYTIVHWHVWTAKLCFVVLYQNVVMAIKQIIKWIIPIIPLIVQRISKLETVGIKRYLTKKSSKK